MLEPADDVRWRTRDAINDAIVKVGTDALPGDIEMAAEAIKRASESGQYCVRITLTGSVNNHLDVRIITKRAENLARELRRHGYEAEEVCDSVAIDWGM